MHLPLQAEFVFVEVNVVLCVQLFRVVSLMKLFVQLFEVLFVVLMEHTRSKSERR